MYRVQEFAALAGVTVRALHHYDQLGLLKPLRRPGSGYRIYRDADFARLEQIVVLKFLGIPLREIGPLLKKTSGLKNALQKQRQVLCERRRQMVRRLALSSERNDRSMAHATPTGTCSPLS